MASLRGLFLKFYKFNLSMRSITVSILTIIFSFFFSKTFPQNLKFEKQNEKTLKICERFIKQNDIPGMAVSISYMDNIIFSKGFGYADVENKIQVEPAKTKFRIASITKMITALTLMKFQEMDSLNIDNTPNFYLDSLSEKNNNFTIRQLAGHLSGLKRNPSEERWDKYNNYSEKDFYRVFKNDELDFEPGSQYQYSNYGYKLIGLVIEKKCGKTITECQDIYTIKKLNMDDTSIDSGNENPDITNFYYKKNGKIEKASYMDCKFKYAQGCHISTSEDLLKLGNVFIYPTKMFNSNRPIQIITKQQKLFSGTKTGYGMGVISNIDFYGNDFWGHNGMENGARSTLRIYQNQKIVIAILINREDIVLDNITSEIGYNYIEALK